MKSIATILIMLSSIYGMAQPAAKAIEDKNLGLQDRYQVMKNNSQTYEDYKVIKEYILEGFWKITTDSFQLKQNQLAEAKQRITTLETELMNSQNELKNHLAGVEGLVYDSKHIAVFGIPFNKGVFLVIVAAMIAGLVVLVVAIAGRMKLLNSEMTEKALIAQSISLEFEDYKRKALEKQTKLSRELQNERNKLVEMRGQKI